MADENQENDEGVLDLEAHAKAGNKPEKSEKYRIRIDKEFRVVEVQEMKGRDILGLVDKTPETYLLSQKLHGGQVKPVGADDTVNFGEDGIERFQTLALDPTEG